MKVIGTHDGRFHADEILAISILKKVYPELRIIRSRDSERWKECDILVDVGGKYDPKKGFFDHHQESFKEKRGNGVPYASAGVVWKYFGLRVVKNDKSAWSYIDKNLVQPVDKVDVDSALSPEGIFLYTLDRAIGSFRPMWNSKRQNWDKEFNRALSFLEKILDNELLIAKSISEADKIVSKAIKQSERKGIDYIFLPNANIPFMEKCEGNLKIKYAIYPYPDGNWHAKGIRKNSSTYETRKPFPIAWRGLYSKDLEKISGIKDAFFCHKAGFVSAANTKEAIIKMVEKSLNS